MSMIINNSQEIFITIHRNTRAWPSYINMYKIKSTSSARFTIRKWKFSLLSQMASITNKTFFTNERILSFHYLKLF